MHGEIWTVRGSGYASKPRPAVIVQSDRITDFDSTVVCLFTSDASLQGETRILVRPSAMNGLNHDCYVMAEKPIAISKQHLGSKIGELEQIYMQRIVRALRVVLDM